MSDGKDMTTTSQDYEPDYSPADESGDNMGNNFHQETAPDIDDNIGNRLSPSTPEVHIDDDIGNRAPVENHGSGRGRSQGRGRNRRNNDRSARGRGRSRGRDQDREQGRNQDRNQGRGGGRPRRNSFERAPITEYVLKSDPEDKRSKAEEICTEIVRLSQREAQVSAELVDENGQPKVVVMVAESDPNDALFARNSAALSALNFLTNKVVNRFPDDRIRLVVHTNSASSSGRRRERVDEAERQATEAMAKDLAEQALKTQRILSVAPMRSELRRVIHLFLENHELVTTMSEGEGAFRKLLIVPKSMLPEQEAAPQAQESQKADSTQADSMASDSVASDVQPAAEADAAEEMVATED